MSASPESSINNPSSRFSAFLTSMPIPGELPESRNFDILLDTEHPTVSNIARSSCSVIASTSREGARLVPVRAARTLVDICDPRGNV